LLFVGLKIQNSSLFHNLFSIVLGKDWGNGFFTVCRLPQLPEERLKKMQEGLLKEWEEEEPSVKKRWARLKTDATANPVQVKFGYALTCHKAQGGQWDAVFVDHGWMKEGPLDTEFYRWLYTAVTRARQQVFLVNLDSRLLD
jgi:hypothetical protein